MLNVITMLCLFNLLFFPSLMLTICYPFSKKAALFWSNYISKHTSRVLFAVLKVYRKFNLVKEVDNLNELPEQFILISNHQSLLDTVCFLCLFNKKDIRFVAKDALSSAPMVGPMLKVQGHCMIPRKGNIKVAIQRLEKFGKTAKEKGYCPLIFPEGTRSRTGKLGKFHPAGFRTLTETSGLPVVTCVIDGGYKLATLKQIVTKMYKGEFKVKILKMYESPKNKEEAQLILDESYELMNNQLKIWREQ